MSCLTLCYENSESKQYTFMPGLYMTRVNARHRRVGMNRGFHLKIEIFDKNIRVLHRQ